MLDGLLYYGDNLDILPRYIKDGIVDLIYLDPPFNSNTKYNMLFQEADGTRASVQIKAFDDTWRWDASAVEAYRAIVEAGGQLSQTMQAFHMILGDSNMLAYMTMMAPRLVELRRVLKSTGSIYLHCDPTASHYLKTLMDAVFGAENFRNEIVWCYSGPSNIKGYFPWKHDVILSYSKTENAIFNVIRIPYTAKLTVGGKNSWSGEKLDATEYIARGKSCEDWWTGIPALQRNERERLGYPTQKPEALLERIIKASSNEGDIVLDPFCGCGTAVAVAQKLKRKWIGIDITYLAVNLIKRRLHDTYGGTAKYKVIGEPTTLIDVQELAKVDKYQFQYWALGLVHARPEKDEEKKGADHGIDGRLYFYEDEKSNNVNQIIFSVKAGHVTVSQVRDLCAVIAREKAQIGVFITLEETTKPMRVEAAGMGVYKSINGTEYPRVQLLTITELLSGKGIEMPSSAQNKTFKKAQHITT